VGGIVRESLKAFKEYMAARFSREDVNTGSDEYQIGV